MTLRRPKIVVRALLFSFLKRPQQSRQITQPRPRNLILFCSFLALLENNYVTQKCTYIGDAKLEYIALSFNSNCYLVGLSGVPDFKLTLWNWRTGVRLHSITTTIRVKYIPKKGAY
jgi:hypothetical protein